MLQPPPNDALVEVSKRLLHTVQVFFHVARRLTRHRVGFAAAPAWDVETALVESFAMHTRGLADFFYTAQRSRHAHDAFAFQFFTSADRWQALVGEPGPWLRNVRFRPERGSSEDRVDRFGEQIAHLNFEVPPLSDYARGWPVMQIAAEIGVALHTFVIEADDAKVSSDFKLKAVREIPVVSRLRAPYHAMGVWTRPAVRRVLHD